MCNFSLSHPCKQQSSLRSVEQRERERDGELVYMFGAPNAHFDIVVVYV